MSKVLIVDDDLIVTELLKALVKLGGHEPTAVTDSRQAVEIAGTVNPDIITLDLMMPGMSGFELCETLHSDPRFEQTPIVIVSARDDKESKDKAFQSGASAFIAKPFGTQEFLGKIKSIAAGLRLSTSLEI